MPTHVHSDWGRDVALIAASTRKKKGFAPNVHQATTGAWTPAKTTTRSSTTVEGLLAGVVVQNLIRVIGPKEITGEWSDPIEHLVP